MAKKACKFTKTGHQPCRAPPLRDGDFCLFHSPEHAEEVAENRRLGGLRRRRERTISTVYDFEGLATAEGIRRLLEIATVDTLGQENSPARSRTLAYLAQVGLKALEAEKLRDHIEALETAVTPRIASKRRNGR